MVVGPEPAVKGCGAFAAGGVDRAVGPPGQQRADESLGFAVGARAVGPRAEVTDAERAAGEGVDRRAVGRAVIRQQALDGDAVGGIEGDRALEEPDRGRGLLVGEDFDVGQPGGVVDADVHVLPADLALALAGGVGCGRVAAALAGHPVPGAALDPAELLDVDVQQLAGVTALIAVRRLRCLQPSLPSPTRSRIAETVESAIARQNAISAPVIRSRRSNTMTSTSSSGVRCGIDRGADERSNSPASPSAPKRSTHLRQVRSLTPAA